MENLECKDDISYLTEKRNDELERFDGLIKTGETDERIENCFNSQFPIVKNMPIRLLVDDVEGVTIDEARETMKKMFEKFEIITGYKPIIVGNESPTKVLFPPENIEPTDG